MKIVKQREDLLCYVNVEYFFVKKNVQKNMIRTVLP